MAEAFTWGVAAASSLLLGGFAALRWRIGDRLLGLVMAFGAGVLISAVAFELVDDAINTSAGEGGVAAGLFVGSAAYFFGDKFLEHRQGTALHGRRRGGWSPPVSPTASTTTVGEGSALALVLGIVLDGIPESFVLGLTVLQEGSVSVAFLVAVFLSNLPEAVAATAGLQRNGWSHGRILGLWLLVMAVSGTAAALGYVVLDGASSSTVAFVLAFAAGAILTMLADAMMPEAFTKAGLFAGPATTFGFALAVLLSAVE
jgi:ZIP family zinc transporter